MAVLVLLKSNFNGPNVFWTMENCSRYGLLDHWGFLQLRCVFFVVCVSSPLLSVPLEGCASWSHFWSHYENTPIQIYWKFHHQNWKFSDKYSDIFNISAQNIDCGYSLEPPHRGGSNEYPQSMFLSRNKKNNVYPCKPQFYYMKVGFKGVKIIKVCFCDDSVNVQLRNQVLKQAQPNII